MGSELKTEGGMLMNYRLLIGFILIVISLILIYLTNYFSNVNSISTSILILFTEIPVLVLESIIFICFMIFKKKWMLLIQAGLSMLLLLMMLYYLI